MLEATAFTGNEPELSGARDDLYEAWLVIPIAQLRQDDGAGVLRICLGVFPEAEAIAAIKRVCDFHWPGKCHWDGQMYHEDDHHINRGFLHRHGDPKR
jgi:hypothetical protein